MKKLLCLVLSLLMVAGLVPAMAEEGLAPLTTDNITLTYACWGRRKPASPKCCRR